MKRRNVLALLASGTVAAVGKVFSSSNTQQPGRGTIPTAPSQPEANPIVAENASFGTTGWQIPPGAEATTEIQAYVSARSVTPGQSLTIYVSTQKEGTSYTLAMYRLGWYQGTGGRLMSSVQLTGKAQGYYVTSTFQLVNCPTAYHDPITGLVEARWQPSYTLPIGHDWTTGVYLVKCIDEQGKQTYTTFDVLGNESAPYIVVTADATYAAYNNWGGQSLYPASSKGHIPATKVSFDRPSMMQQGSDQVLVFEANTIRWLEREWYNVSYNSKLRGTAWTFDPQISGASLLHSTLVQGTGLHAGQSFHNGLVGYEWDKVFENGYTPPGLHILATSPVLSIEGIHDTSSTTL